MISSVIFRRSIFDEVAHFNPALRVAEDYDLYLRIARAHPIWCHSAVVAEYRMHDANMSRNSALMLTTTLQVLQSQQSYLGNDGGRQSSFRIGMRTWRKQYGRKLAAELGGCPALRSVDRLGYKLQTLAIRYPQGILLFLLLRLHPGRRLTGSPASRIVLLCRERCAPGSSPSGACAASLTYDCVRSNPPPHHNRYLPDFDVTLVRLCVICTRIGGRVISTGA